MGLCTILFAASLPTISTFGIRYYKLMDSYTCIVGLMIIAFFEVAGLCIHYSTDSLEKLFLEKEVTPKVPKLIKFCWKWVCPLTVFIIMAFSFTNLNLITYKGENYSTG